MELLVKRDTNVLSAVQGRAEIDGDVPEMLRQPRIIMPSEVLRQGGNLLEDRLIVDGKDSVKMARYLSRKPKNSVLYGLWSGYRSAIVRAPDGLLYRFKGVSWNIDNPSGEIDWDKSYNVFGGQNKYSAVFEKQMCDEFNRVLANEGIDSVMECVGYWHYKKTVEKEKLSASVIRVKGDTRLDELMWAFDRCIDADSLVGGRVSTALASLTARFYYDVGFIVGQLKMLMTRNNQTWGAHKERTNAGIFNVVLYWDKDRIKVGLVDFDASCNKKDFGLAKLHRLMETEYDAICRNISWFGVASIRTSPADSHLKLNNTRNCYNNSFVQHFYRTPFANGFKNGYACKRLTCRVRDGIPVERFYEIANLLRQQTSDKRLTITGL